MKSRSLETLLIVSDVSRCPSFGFEGLHLVVRDYTVVIGIDSLNIGIDVHDMRERHRLYHCQSSSVCRS